MSRVLSASYTSSLVRLIIFSLVLLAPALCACQPQVGNFLCRSGTGAFESDFSTGIHIQVGASKNVAATLASRSCMARIGWDKMKLVVANAASEVDLDGFGVDFGDGAPAAAFQIRQTENGCCVDYRIYSIDKPPHLFRTLTGGRFFSASDTDLDGRVEIWAGEGTALTNFEGLTPGELDFTPTVIFRLDHGKLLDVSAEFQSYFDKTIARIKAELSPRALQEFKDTDGKLAEPSTPASADRPHRMRAVKVKVLGIVWAYLYSGRETEAWRALSDMWPVADVDRIRDAIQKTRGMGLISQTDGPAPPSTGKKKRAQIFDARNVTGAGKLEVIPPQAILLEFPPSVQNQASPQMLDLTIDAAGKVRAAEPVGVKKTVSAEQAQAASTWKFIPAMKDGQPVASRLRLSVSSKQ